MRHSRAPPDARRDDTSAFESTHAFETRLLRHQLREARVLAKRVAPSRAIPPFNHGQEQTRFVSARSKRHERETESTLAFFRHITDREND